MNLQTVITNLRNTIAGKEEALARYEARRDIPRAPGDQMVMIAAIDFLKININELKRILADVEQCRDYNAGFEDGHDQGVELGYNRGLLEQPWRDNPDRMGGQFTQDEINRAGEWR